MVPSDCKVLIQRFYQLQSERIETYRLFEERHLPASQGSDIGSERGDRLPAAYRISFPGFATNKADPAWLDSAVDAGGHEAYLRTGPHYDFEHYKQLVHEITQAFSGISTEVLEIKGRLHREFDRADLSEHIEKLQGKEKQKLELTAKLQLAKQHVQDHPEDEGWQERIQEIKHEIIKSKEALSEIMQDFKYDSEECD